MKTAKAFDCVAMKRAAQRRIRQEVEGMTGEQEIAFFRSGSKEFEEAVKQAKRAGKKGRGGRTRRRQTGHGY